MSGKIKVDEVSVANVVVVVVGWLVGLAGKRALGSLTHSVSQSLTHSLAHSLASLAKTSKGWAGLDWMRHGGWTTTTTTTTIHPTPAHPHPHPLPMALLAALAQEQ